MDQFITIFHYRQQTDKMSAIVDTQQSAETKMPSQTTFANLFKKAIMDDKPVLFDYWVSSLDKTVSIGVRQIPGVSGAPATTEKILVRSEEEYTSPIQNIFRSGNEFVVVTENSIYVVDSGIPIKKITV